jgi:hypothetical protein
MVKGFFEKTRVVLEGDCEKGAETRHTVEVHLGLTDDIRDINVIVVSHQLINGGFLFGGNFLAFFTTFSWFSTLSNWLR